MKLLLIVDLQNGLLFGERPIHRRTELLGTVASLLGRARAEEVPIVFIEDTDVGPAGSHAGATHADVAPLPGEIVMRKGACDAFFGTALEAHCRSLGVQTLVVDGCKTESCVDTTCRRATTLGFSVTLVDGGNSTTDSAVLPAARIIAHHQHLLAGFGCEIGLRVFEISVVPQSEVSFP